MSNPRIRSEEASLISQARKKFMENGLEFKVITKPDDFDNFSVYVFNLEHDLIDKYYGLTVLQALSKAIIGEGIDRAVDENSEEELELVDHPNHYGGVDAEHEVISVIEAWDLGFSLGNVVKYISRSGKKVGVDNIVDLEKAKWYLGRHIARLKLEQEND